MLLYFTKQHNTAHVTKGCLNKSANLELNEVQAELLKALFSSNSKKDAPKVSSEELLDCVNALIDTSFVASPAPEGLTGLSL